MTKTLSVIYCFPRSGGTLLNQCLLCEPANVVLSEVNPAGCVMAVEQQAAQWFGLLGDAEAAGRADQPYLDQIGLVLQRASQAGKTVCLRDWTGLNFLENISPWHGVPSRQLEQRLYLHHAGYKLREIALLRRSRATYLSILENIPELKVLSPEDFCTAYRAYLEQVAPARIYRLEELQRDRQPVLRSICSDLGLRFPADFETRFHSIRSVTGNNTLPKLPASAGWTSIRSAGPAAPVASPGGEADAYRFEQLDELAGYDRPQQ